MINCWGFGPHEEVARWICQVTRWSIGQESYRSAAWVSLFFAVSFLFIEKLYGFSRPPGAEKHSVQDAPFQQHRPNWTLRCNRNIMSSQINNFFSFDQQFKNEMCLFLFKSPTTYIICIYIYLLKLCDFMVGRCSVRNIPCKKMNNVLSVSERSLSFLVAVQCCSQNEPN